MCKYFPNLAAVFGIFATLGILYTLGIPDWQRKSVNYGTPEYYEAFQGLWVTCEYKNPGALCHFLRSRFPGDLADIKTMRIMMSVSAGLAVIGLIFSLFGLNCSSVVSKDCCHRWTGRSGSGVMLIAGLLCAVSVSWDFYNASYERQNGFGTYVTSGTSIYVGWGASVFAILAGIMGCCNCNCCCGSSESEDKKGYIPLHPDFQSQMYPNSMFGSVGEGGFTSYKPASQPFTNLLVPTPNFPAEGYSDKSSSPASTHTYVMHHA